jgi:hypothetical protein
MARMLALVAAPQHRAKPKRQAKRHKYVVHVGVVGAVVSRDDVVRLQKALASEVGTLGQVVATNVTKFDQPTLDGWRDFRNRALAFAGETAPLFFTASAMDAGEALERELQTWYPRIQALGLTTPPAPTPPPAATPGILGSLGDLAKLAPFVLVFLLVRELKR